MTSTELTTTTWMDEIDQLPAEIPGAAALEPGRLSWYHGVDAGKIKTPGVFFGRDTAFTELPPVDRWELDDRYSEKGESGFAAPVLRLMFIANRSQWFIPGEQGDRPTWLSTYEAGAKKMVEYLVLVDGIADPMVLSVSGKYKAGPIAEILSAYRRGALAQAMRKVKRTLPPWAFWLTIGGKKGPDGRPAYEDAKDNSGVAQGSKVTPPALLAAPEPVTTAQLLAGADAWQQYQEWTRFKRGQLGDAPIEASYTVEDRPALPAPAVRNVPQPIDLDDGDAPF